MALYVHVFVFVFVIITGGRSADGVLYNLILVLSAHDVAGTFRDRRSSKHSTHTTHTATPSDPKKVAAHVDGITLGMILKSHQVVGFFRRPSLWLRL